MAKKELVNWEAREYIVREKNTGWWIGFAVVVVAMRGGDFNWTMVIFGGDCTGCNFTGFTCDAKTAHFALLSIKRWFI